jgi:YbgC/YbaW family acyl-CoA thioester hydrolase
VAASGTCVYRVQWGDTDTAGVVFYPNYFRWFDHATHELFRGLEETVASLAAAGIVLPIIETHGRFLAPLVYDDEILIASRVSEVRTRAFRVEHVVTQGSRTVADGYEVRVWVRIGEGGTIVPQPIPSEWKQRLGAAEP